MESEAIGTAASNSDFSLVSLVFDADPVVKLVLLFLLGASVWSWMVIGEKLFSLGSARKKARQFEQAFWSGRTEEFDMRPGQVPGDAAGRVFASAAREWSDARRGAHQTGEAAALVNRAERSMRAAVDRELGKAGSGLGVLATIGSASPFIGLFGTVWGIMNAFLNIAAQQDTSLGTVAGPIAEALFATGMGLVAAIPAVIFYNKFTGDLTKLGDQLDTFSQDVLVRLSRRASDASRD
ncbi:MotA/TolQ/ExbB proton channel family protein [Hyphomonas johnsonii]|jgi:biopolymer transport protein TolQ|uniref:Protein TolQ n=1 Tax=Hyphomonas johnsonii MHS-2 TaxID=1280950 RepID=A0A059FPA5_9PROT|nr:MotA/TolQ/ExbB proton channel family protein [Hyphomonas johnsonii]KCZ92303.1 protein TolQ [Hyphomonas johnsonii MHS-2]